MVWFDGYEIWNITTGHLKFLRKQIMNTPDKITYVVVRDFMYRYQQGLLYGENIKDLYSTGMLKITALLSPNFTKLASTQAHKMKTSSTEIF
jgi:hypothetical protein